VGEVRQVDSLTNPCVWVKVTVTKPLPTGRQAFRQRATVTLNKEYRLLTLITKSYGGTVLLKLDIIFLVGQGFSLAISRPKGLPYEITVTYS